jgi:F1F0 ATPase subunit 2
MAMNEFLALAAALAAGLLLGAIFFGGLWWTVVRGVSSRRPALWFIGSKLLRMVIVLGGFYLVGGDNWERWLACLVGFVLARVAVWRLTRPRGQDGPVPAPEARYAP